MMAADSRTRNAMRTYNVAPRTFVRNTLRFYYPVCTSIAVQGLTALSKLVAFPLARLDVRWLPNPVGCGIHRFGQTRNSNTIQNKRAQIRAACGVLVLEEPYDCTGIPCRVCPK